MLESNTGFNSLLISACFSF